MGGELHASRQGFLPEVRQVGIPHPAALLLAQLTAAAAAVAAPPVTLPVMLPGILPLRAAALPPPCVRLVAAVTVVLLLLLLVILTACVAGVRWCCITRAAPGLLAVVAAVARPLRAAAALPPALPLPLVLVIPLAVSPIPVPAAVTGDTVAAKLQRSTIANAAFEVRFVNTCKMRRAFLIRQINKADNKSAEWHEC